MYYFIFNFSVSIEVPTTLSASLTSQVSRKLSMVKKQQNLLNFSRLFPRFRSYHWQFQWTDPISMSLHFIQLVLPFMSAAITKPLPCSPLPGGRKVLVNNSSQPEFQERIPQHSLGECSVAFFIVPHSNHWMMLSGNRRNSKNSLSLIIK